MNHSLTGMRSLPGGKFLMGSEKFYPEEAPTHQVEVAPFAIDARPVTNKEFASFVDETGYVTLAEQPPDPKDYPGILPEMMSPGSLVFVSPNPVLASIKPESWWQHVKGASWRRPYGPDAKFEVPHDHPVVHIAYRDAEAYARWAGKRLPSETEFEYAARGGLDGATFAWGEDLTPDGKVMANIWLEGFPFASPHRSTPPYTSSVGSYPANPYGLFDLIGNVWEWTTADADGPPGNNGCCGTPTTQLPLAHRKIMKGGSHLCAPNYCRRYRPAAKWPQPIDTSTTHTGFRCAVSLDE